MKAIANNKNLAGQQADKKEFFGKFKRYAIAPVHTRFDINGNNILLASIMLSLSFDLLRRNGNICWSWYLVYSPTLIVLAILAFCFSVMWFVWDAQVVDDLGYATVIRQSWSKEEALKGLTI